MQSPLPILRAALERLDAAARAYADACVAYEVVRETREETARRAALDMMAARQQDLMRAAREVAALD